MLRFERQVVASLIETDDRAQRAAIEDYVDATLSDMPEHLRAGVVAESLALAAWAFVRRASAAEVLSSLQRSPVGLLRQYERLLAGLVLFAEQELVAGPAT
ncbi:MAG TPA: hypothetical protein VMN58_04695 [Acidimicrobiales bacterium]|nr:hypothetical protein [Acidimicrobiales bacterium]